MKAKYSVIISAILLVSCSSVGVMNNRLTDASNKEAQAWQELQPIAQKECAKGKDPDQIKPSQAIEFSRCVQKLVDKIVLPVAVYPDLLLSVRPTTTRNSELYASGKISNTEWLARSQENSALYLRTVEARAQQAMNAAYIDDQIRATRMQAAGIAMQQASQQSSADTNLSCMQTGPFTNCHSY